MDRRGRSRERDQRSRSPPQDPRDDRRYTRPQEPRGDYYGRPAERQDTYRNTGSYGGDRVDRGGYGDRGRDTYSDRPGSYGGYGGGYDRDRGDSRADRGDRGGGDHPRGEFGGGRGRGDYGGGGGGGRSGGGMGGRGGGGGGGRGGPKKPHMGEIDSIQRLVRNSRDLSDEACMQVIDPPLQDRDRDQYFEAAEGKKLHASPYWMPRLDVWRASLNIGHVLDNHTQIVRCNYFRMNPERIPETIYHYNISIFRYDREMHVGVEDLAKSNDKQMNTGIMKFLIDSKEPWRLDGNRNVIGLAYDGKSSLYTSKHLPNFDGEERFQQDVTYPPRSNTTYSVLLSLAGEIHPPRNQEQWRNAAEQSSLQALDIALLSFARWQLDEQHPTWVIAGSKAFRSDGTTYQFSPAYLGRLGFHASLKCCISGLLLVSDVSVTCFLKGGSLINLMVVIGGCRDVNDLYEKTSPTESRGLPTSMLQTMEEVFKSCRIKMIHLGHSKKFKGFGPAASHQDSAFSVDDRLITVADYFESMAHAQESYRKFLPSGRLRYPHLPCVQVGSRNRPIRVPPELIEVVPGQSRQRNLPSEIAANIIRHAAMAPNDRFTQIGAESLSNGLLHELAVDDNCRAFGLDGIDPLPMQVQGVILPPPKLQYGNRIIEPELKGSWNLVGGVTFAHPAPLDKTSGPGHRGGSHYPYGLLVVYTRSQPGNILHLVEEFQQRIENDSRTLGIPLQMCTSQPFLVEGRKDVVSNALQDLQRRGARIAIVLLHADVYAAVKLAGDEICLPTQCVKWTNIRKPPKSYHTSLLVKINEKMGGVNHTLASRAPRGRITAEEAADSFQSPPKSISWMFDDPCMVMGVDVNHPEISGTVSTPFGGPSVAAVVASMDGKLGQYCAHISSGAGEPNLVRAISALLEAFCLRNEGRMPRRIIVYRDGVADNQFESVLDKELNAFKNAFMERGYSEGYVKIAIVMCQKRHSARFVYETQSGGKVEYANPCVGLCVDARHVIAEGSGSGMMKQEGSNTAAVGSINSPNTNEFYLNSHAAVLGTSKPCKYTLIYDEIGFKLAELELLTFWTTHLYGRCTRSVSYATPAYYAHWAARRGKVLLNAGASTEELVRICENWMKDDQRPSLYFI